VKSPAPRLQCLAKPSQLHPGPIGQNNGTRNAASNRFTCCDKVGCATFSSSAARTKLPVRATERKYRSCCKSIDTLPFATESRCPFSASRLVPLNLAVPQEDDPVRVHRNVMLVRHQHNGIALLV
jgi:hypothetical protein